MSKMNCPAIESDTDWEYSSNARPMRGYHDYERRIVFKPGTDQEMQRLTINAIMAPYKNKGGPTWSSSQQTGLVWYLKQGYDSGD